MEKCVDEFGGGPTFFILSVNLLEAQGHSGLAESWGAGGGYVFP